MGAGRSGCITVFVAPFLAPESSGPWLTDTLLPKWLPTRPVLHPLTDHTFVVSERLHSPWGPRPSRRLCHLHPLGVRALVL